MTKSIYAHVDELGRLVLPQKLSDEWGIQPGDKLLIDNGEHGFRLRAPVTTLRKVYIELTNQCNLNCSTCMRNVWDVSYGYMAEETFEKILSALENITPKPEIFIGGYGEPLYHPKCMEFLNTAKSHGFRVSMITNGILLTEKISQKLIDISLDKLWVSLDGASQECYTDVRLGNALPEILNNIRVLRRLQYQQWGYSPWMMHPYLGIAFVAMKRNIHDLPEVLKIGERFGALEYSISNVLAHNDDLQKEGLYSRALDSVKSAHQRKWLPYIHLPRLDVNPATSEAIAAVLKGHFRVDLFGGELDLNGEVCPFVQRGSIAVRWDGKVSPCLPLMYTHTHYLDDRKRTSLEFLVGDIQQKSLKEIWTDPVYVELRGQIEDFDFSPCSSCNSCEYADNNNEDCYGNVHPTCGGCLWAQGLIRCP